MSSSLETSDRSEEETDGKSDGDLTIVEYTYESLFNVSETYVSHFETSNVLGDKGNYF